MAQAAHVHPDAAANSDPVRYAVDFEFADRQVPDLHRVVDQLGVVAGLVRTETVSPGCLAPHRGRDAPVSGDRVVRGQDLEFAGRVFLPLDREEDTGAVEVCVRRIQVRPAHAQVVGEYAGDQRQRPTHDPGTPATLVELGQLDVEAIRLRAYRHDVACVIPDHVAAGNPRRHREHLSVR